MAVGKTNSVVVGYNGNLIKKNGTFNQKEKTITINNLNNYRVSEVFVYNKSGVVEYIDYSYYDSEDQAYYYYGSKGIRHTFNPRTSPLISNLMIQESTNLIRIYIRMATYSKFYYSITLSEIE